MKKKIAIFGSTGSIGKTLINIIKKDKKNFEIVFLSANKNYTELIKQVKLFNVKNIVITDKSKFLIVKKILKHKPVKVYNDFTNLKKIFKKKIDYTMCAISGIDGLYPTLNIIRFTKKIAIANKEALICGWSLILSHLKKYKTNFIPVDSEHFSIWSLIGINQSENIEKIFITASGGPFYKYPLSKFNSITPKQALKHPNWNMGKKISIDSATMMNKVFEIIEARNIFNISYDKLFIFIHPKSYVHAIVKFNNGLSKILLHDTTMKIPIFNSLYDGFNKKIKSKNININKLNNLNFQKPNLRVFPAIKILKKMPIKSSLFETIIVSANDALVHLFLNKKIKFTDISKTLNKILILDEFKKYRSIKPKNINDIKKLNKYVRFKTNSLSI
jgi:1-deoxy-D-xylulose-5-phosphate reductoisomerase